MVRLDIATITEWEYSQTNFVLTEKGEAMAKKKEPDRLTQAVLQAQAAGLSYGKWKAMQPRVEIPKKKPVADYVVMTCAFCGCEFVNGNNRRTKYCGDRCRARAESQRRFEKKNARGDVDK
mgnify:CR=1 FL=1